MGDSADLVSAIYDPRDPKKLSCGIFKRVQVLTQPLGGHLIGWELFENYTLTAPFYFYVDFGRSGSDGWEALNTSPIIDTCTYFDVLQRHWDHLADFYYRVRLVLPNETDPATGVCRVIASQPQQANGILSKRDWLIAREIARKEYLLQRKGTNKTARGYLLKRKRFGIACPDCREFDTTEVQDGRCPTCFGTSFTGGYFPGVEFSTIFVTAPSREFKRDDKIAMRNDVVRSGRAVAYPYVDTNDVFVRRDNGERFYVNKIETAAEVGGIPIVVILELRLAPVTDIVYTIPVKGGSSSSSSAVSSSSAAVCDSTVGLDSTLENW